MFINYGYNSWIDKYTFSEPYRVSEKYKDPLSPLATLECSALKLYVNIATERTYVDNIVYFYLNFGYI